MFCIHFKIFKYEIMLALPAASTISNWCFYGIKMKCKHSGQGDRVRIVHLRLMFI